MTASAPAPSPGEPATGLPDDVGLVPRAAPLTLPSSFQARFRAGFVGRLAADSTVFVRANARSGQLRRLVVPTARAQQSTPRPVTAPRPGTVGTPRWWHPSLRPDAAAEPEVTSSGPRTTAAAGAGTGAGAGAVAEGAGQGRTAASAAASVASVAAPSPAAQPVRSPGRPALPERTDLSGALPERGLQRVVRRVPDEKTWTPGSFSKSTAPKTIPMRLPAEVRAAGSMITPQDGRRRPTSASSASPVSSAPTSPAQPGNPSRASSTPTAVGTGAGAGSRPLDRPVPSSVPGRAAPAGVRRWIRRRALASQIVSARAEQSAAAAAAAARPARSVTPGASPSSRAAAAPRSLPTSSGVQASAATAGAAAGRGAAALRTPPGTLPARAEAPPLARALAGGRGLLDRSPGASAEIGPAATAATGRPAGPRAGALLRRSTASGSSLPPEGTSPGADVADPASTAVGPASAPPRPSAHSAHSAHSAPASSGAAGTDAPAGASSVPGAGPRPAGLSGLGVDAHLSSSSAASGPGARPGALGRGPAFVPVRTGSEATHRSVAPRPASLRRSSLGSLARGGSMTALSRLPQVPTARSTSPRAATTPLVPQAAVPGGAGRTAAAASSGTPSPRATAAGSGAARHADGATASTAPAPSLTSVPPAAGASSPARLAAAGGAPSPVRPSAAGSAPSPAGAGASSAAARDSATPVHVEAGLSPAARAGLAYSLASSTLRRGVGAGDAVTARALSAGSRVSSPHAAAGSRSAAASRRGTLTAPGHGAGAPLRRMLAGATSAGTSATTTTRPAAGSVGSARSAGSVGSLSTSTTAGGGPRATVTSGSRMSAGSGPGALARRVQGGGEAGRGAGHGSGAGRGGGAARPGQAATSGTGRDGHQRPGAAGGPGGPGAPGSLRRLSVRPGPAARRGVDGSHSSPAEASGLDSASRPIAQASVRRWARTTPSGTAAVTGTAAGAAPRTPQHDDDAPASLSAFRPARPVVGARGDRGGRASARPTWVPARAASLHAGTRPPSAVGSPGSPAGLHAAPGDGSAARAGSPTTSGSAPGTGSDAAAARQPGGSGAELRWASVRPSPAAGSRRATLGAQREPAATLPPPPTLPPVSDHAAQLGILSKITGRSLAPPRGLPPAQGLPMTDGPSPLSDLLASSGDGRPGVLGGAGLGSARTADQTRRSTTPAQLADIEQQVLEHLDARISARLDGELARIIEDRVIRRVEDRLLDELTRRASSFTPGVF